MKYGAYRIIAGGAPDQSVSSSSSCGHEVYPFIPRWSEEKTTLKSFVQRLKLFVSSKKKDEKYMCDLLTPLFTFDPERDTFRHVRCDLTDAQLESSGWIGCSDVCPNFSSLSWSEINSGKRPLSVGFLQTRVSATKLW